MKSIILGLALVAIAAAAPVEKEPAKILRSENNQDPSGSYTWAFESDDGIQRSESAQTKEVLDEENKPHTILAVKGSYSYVDKEGKTNSITYYADESGYHPEGDSIPKLVEAVVALLGRNEKSASISNRLQ